jgi:hypothetical protein
MSIKINLLAEALAEEDLRRRDPVKRAIFLGAFLIALSLVWFSSILLVHVIANQELTRVQADIQSHTNDYSQVQIKLKKIADAQKRLEALQKLSDSRFLQGNLMNAFQQLYVPNVQLTRLRIDQSYAVAGGTADVAGPNGVIPGRSGVATEKILITLDAKDYSANSGDAVNRFQDALSKQAYFKSSLNPTNGIRLSNLSAPQSSFDSKPYVLFTMECRFSDKAR